MATTVFEWVISQLNCAVESEGLPDVINVIHWRYNATQEHDGKLYFADTYGSSSVAQPNPQNFIPYEDLTFDIVCGWLESSMDVAALDANLDTQIANLINPPIVSPPLPWIS